MISGIGSSASYLSSLFAANGTNGSSGSSGTSSSSSLSQTEEKLFAAIDSNGDGSISQSEFSSFLSQATGGSAQSASTNALFSQMSNGSGSISLQQFESNAGDLVGALQSGTGAASSGSSFGSSILWGSSLRFSFRRHSPLRSTPWGVVAAGFSEAQLVSNAATQAVAAVTRNK